MGEGSRVGLDVHARSVVAGVIDPGTGEVRSLRLPPGGETAAWLQTLPAPVRVVYEAGPTGYRLARACAEAGINCVVAAPSRVRAAADRVRTDRRDAERLARLLRLGEITPVRIPTLEEEAARDLVCAREDARGRTTSGFAGGGSTAARSRSSSTSVTGGRLTRKADATRSIRRSLSSPPRHRTSTSSGWFACARRSAPNDIRNRVGRRRRVSSSHRTPPQRRR